MLLIHGTMDFILACINLGIIVYGAYMCIWPILLKNCTCNSCWQNSSMPIRNKKRWTMGVAHPRWLNTQLLVSKLINKVLLSHSQVTLCSLFCRILIQNTIFLELLSTQAFHRIQGIIMHISRYARIIVVNFYMDDFISY